MVEKRDTEIPLSGPRLWLYLKTGHLGLQTGHLGLQTGHLGLKTGYTRIGIAISILSVLVVVCAFGVSGFTTTSHPVNTVMELATDTIQKSDANRKVSTTTVECTTCTGSDEDSPAKMCPDLVTPVPTPVPTHMPTTIPTITAVSKVTVSLGTKRFSISVSPQKTVGYVLSKAKKLLPKAQFPEKFPFALWFGRVLNASGTAILC